MINEIKIPERFEQEIIVHALKNEVLSSEQVPLILGIHGSPGDGKSFMLSKVLDRLQYQTFQIEASDLEHEFAGEPAKLIKSTYNDAAQSALNTKLNSAIVIDDLDTASGVWGANFQYTSNLQSNYATIMRISDHPLRSNHERTVRVPVYITGNNLSLLHSPLTRFGRMKTFFWQPNEEELNQIVSSIFFHLGNDSCQQIMDTFPSKPVAFYSTLRAALVDKYIWSCYEDRGFQGASAFLKREGANIDLVTELATIIGLGEKLCGEYESMSTNHISLEAQS